MATLDNASLNNEPAVSGWWVAACFSAAGLILLFAALIQQASKLSGTITSMFGGQSSETVQAVSQNPVPEPASILDAQVNEPVVVSDVVNNNAVEQVVDDVDVIGTEMDVPARSTITASKLDPSSDDSLTPSEAEPSAIELSETVIDEAAEAAEVAEVAEVAEATVLEITNSETAVNEASAGVADTLTRNISISETEAGNELLVEPSSNDLASVALEEPNSDVSTEAPISDESSEATSREPQSAGVPENSPSSTEQSLALLRRDVLTEMTRRSSQIRFIEQSAELTPEGERLLGQAFEDLFLYAESDVVIQVRSLDAAVESTNRLLSNDRAESIRAFLINRGFEAERLIISLLPDADVSTEQQTINIQANL